MRRVTADVIVAAQAFWARFELPLLLILMAVWMFVCIDIGAGRAR